MILLFILQTFFAVTAATRGQGEYPLYDWRDYYRSFFELSELTPEQKMRKEVLNIEINIMCHVYNICNLSENLYKNPIIKPFEPSIVPNDTESVEVFKHFKILLEDKYGERFSEAPTEKKYSGGVNFSDFLAIVGDFFHKFKFPNYDSSIFDFRNGTDTGYVFSDYFASESRKKEAKRKFNVLIDGVKLFQAQYGYYDRRVFFPRFYGSVNIDEEIAKIEEIYSLILAYVFDGHSSNFFDVHQRLGELKKYTADAVVQFRELLEKAFGTVLYEYKAKQGEYDTKEANSIVNELFITEKSIRDNWRHLFAKFKNSPNAVDVAKSDEHIRTRLRYFRMFNSIEELKRARTRLEKIFKQTIRGSSSDAIFNDERWIYDEIDEVVDILAKLNGFNSDKQRSSIRNSIFSLGWSDNELRSFKKYLFHRDL